MARPIRQSELESVARKGKSIPSRAALVEAMFIAELENLILTAGNDLDVVVPPVPGRRDERRRSVCPVCSANRQHGAGTRRVHQIVHTRARAGTIDTLLGAAMRAWRA
jgi:hypothetical protein